jgi:hypothetical protein
MERQYHGFNFEDAVKKVLGEEDRGYTAKFDIVHNEMPISVKFIRNGGSVDCGSFKRIWEHCVNTIETGESWYMVLGRHEGKTCTTVYELEFTPERCKQVMGKLPTEEVYAVDKMLSQRTFPAGKEEADKARLFHRAWKAEWKHLFGKITPAPKVDTKTQRRMQCTINNTNLKYLFGETLVQSKRYEELVGVQFGQ